MELIKRIDEMTKQIEDFGDVWDGEHGLLEECKATIEQLQAKIDWLMLEYCPDEMTEEQMDNWGKHQVLAKLTGVDDGAD